MFEKRKFLIPIKPDNDNRYFLFKFEQLLNTFTSFLD